MRMELKEEDWRDRAQPSASARGRTLVEFLKSVESLKFEQAVLGRARFGQARSSPTAERRFRMCLMKEAVRMVAADVGAAEGQPVAGEYQAVMALAGPQGQRRLKTLGQMALAEPG